MSPKIKKMLIEYYTERAHFCYSAREKSVTADAAQAFSIMLNEYQKLLDKITNA